MENHVISSAKLYAGGFHKSVTIRASVAGALVNVLAPETLRAVIRISVSVYKKPTLLAGEVLESALKFFRSSHDEMIQQAIARLLYCV